MVLCFLTLFKKYSLNHQRHVSAALLCIIDLHVCINLQPLPAVSKCLLRFLYIQGNRHLKPPQLMVLCFLLVLESRPAWFLTTHILYKLLGFEGSKS